MESDHASIWGGLDADRRVRLAEHAHGAVELEDVRALPMVDGMALAAHIKYEHGVDRSEGFELVPGFAAWIDAHTTEGKYARGWDVLTPSERKTLAGSTTGNAEQSTILRLAATAGVTGTYWPGFQSGPDHWNVGMGFVQYVRERLGRD